MIVYIILQVKKHFILHHHHRICIHCRNILPCWHHNGSIPEQPEIKNNANLLTDSNTTQIESNTNYTMHCIYSITYLLLSVTNSTYNLLILSPKCNSWNPTIKKQLKRKGKSGDRECKPDELHALWAHDDWGCSVSSSINQNKIYRNTLIKEEKRTKYRNQVHIWAYTTTSYQSNILSLKDNHKQV